MRQEYEMTEEQLEAILDACKSVPVISFDGINNAFGSPQENANRAWRNLGNEMGFDGKTVRPIPDKGQRFFTAEPEETQT